MTEAVPDHPITLYVDADACPVKDEVYRVADRFALQGVALAVVVVANSPIAIPRSPMISRVVVNAALDAADDYIAAHAQPGDVVITADIPLADRAVKAGAEVLTPDGRTFTPDTIGLALATRNLLSDLRSAGSVTGGPRAFSPRDRSAFLQALDRTLRRLSRNGYGRTNLPSGN